MKKVFKGITCLALGASIAIGIPLGTAGCGGGSDLDPENRALQLAIGDVDEKFNPLYYTSQNDGEIANLTQVSLMTVDASGNLAYGNDQPTVALNYLETYYNAAGNAIGSGTGDDAKTLGEAEGAVTTTFEFVIKNGVKFSDGEDLTVMDVLFNLYVYLDKSYSGSSTIYSTKILGLQAYREQDPDADDGVMTDSDEEYESAADDRVQRLLDWADGELDPETLSADEKAEFDKDVSKAYELFEDEITSSWNLLETSWETAFKEKYRFTEPWEAYYFQQGVIEEQMNGNEFVYDSQGRYLTTLDPEGGVAGAEVKHQQLINEITAEYTQDKIDAYKAAHPGADDKIAKAALQKEFAIEKVKGSYCTRSGITTILERATGANLYDYFIATERKKANEGKEGVDNISGIQVYKSDKLVNRYDNSKTVNLGEQHDILRISIKGVDPKAKWNFSFSVAPMHYYSDKSDANVYYKAAMADYTSGAVYSTFDGSGKLSAPATGNFGVKRDDVDWLTDNVAKTEKNKLPMGAGPYKATRWDHGSGAVSGGTFFYNKIAYFERNTNFTTLGSGINNAIIKYVNYRVLSDDRIIEALSTGTIDYGEPIAKKDNYDEVAKYSTLAYTDYLTGGYGYVGINPKAVPDHKVRQAIMKAFDLSAIREYYGEDNMNTINWPVSTTSWASPDFIDPTHQSRYYAMETSVTAIQNYITEEGYWQLSGGKLVATADNPYGITAGTQIKITFTIAGESQDHPAFNMFKYAQTFLNSCGMDISVEPDQQALIKLATGKLEVWAAAWSSSIDPDPYQIYSIYSKATSTKNWNKDEIVKNEGGKFNYEYDIAMRLAQLIDEGRSTLNKDKRILKYASCYELIMDLAVEFPTYQRKDLCVYNQNVLDAESFTAASHIMGPLGKLWEIRYK